MTTAPNPSPRDAPPPNDAVWQTEIELAAQRLAPYLSRTPLIRSRFLSAELGRPCFLKLETTQPVGAFKVRPAFNSLLADLELCRAKGVVTNSSGNFAQAVAYAASVLGVDASIVMMRGASRLKRDRTRDLGGNVVLCDNSFAARAEATERIRKDSGRVPVHPFDSVESIAGNGTLGLELLEQVEGDFSLFVPISGGGLIAGTALAVKAGRPSCRVFGVQAEANPSTRESLKRGARVRIEPLPSLADALTVPTPGANTFPIIQELVEDVFLVDEDSMRSAIRTVALEDRVVIEAGGAVSVAAALAHTERNTASPVVCVLSGGNIDPATLASILSGDQ